MTPEQAIEILDRVAANALLTRDHHIAAQQAVDVLRNLIKEANNGDRSLQSDTE
jgi:hypothetical protein